MGRSGGRIARERAGGPVVTEVAAADPQLVKRLAQLERELARRAPAVAERRRALLEQQLAEVGERLAASEAERVRLAGELAELHGRHGVLAAEHRAVTEQRQAAAAFEAEPQVEAYWTRSSPQEGCDVGGRRYHGRGADAGVRRVSLPGGREVEVPGLHGEPVTLPLGDFEVLQAAGFVELASEVDAALVAAGLR